MKGIAFLIFCLFLLTACQQVNQKDLVGNKEVDNEIFRLEKVSLERNLTSQDYSNLRELTKKDPVAADIFKEIDWLLEHNELEHASHGLGLLQSYIETGNSQECFGHELEHIGLYLKYNDEERAKEAIEELDVDAWINHNEDVKKKFPQYYKNFDEVKIKAIKTVDSLKKGDYSLSSLKDLPFLEDNAPC